MIEQRPDDWGFGEWVDVYASRRPDTYLIEWLFKVRNEIKPGLIYGVTG